MSEKFENIDDLFKKELEGYAPEVPEDSWDDIALALVKAPRKRRLALFYKIAAGFALLLSTGILSHYVITSNKEKSATLTASSTQATPDKPEDKHSNNIALSHKSKPEKNNSELRIGQDSAHKERIDIPQTVQTANNIELASSHHLVYEGTSNPLTISRDDDNPQNWFIDSLPKLKKVQPILASIPSPAKEGELIQPHLSSLQNNSDLIDETEYELVAYDDTPKDRQNNWLIGGQAGPQYAYRNISSHNADKELINSYNTNEDGVYAYAGGINIEYSPANRLSIQSGIHYSKIGQQKDGEIRTVESVSNFMEKSDSPYSESKTIKYDFINSTGDIVFNNTKSNTRQNASNELDIAIYSVKNGLSSDSESSETITLSQYFEYIEIPVIARYKIVDRKFDIHFLGGLSTNILVRNAVYLEDQSDAVGYTAGVKPVNYSATAGVGFAYNMPNRINVTVEPQIKYYLNKQVSNSDVDVYPYTIGIMTGFTYSF